MSPEAWGAFHDGTLTAIEGRVPGTVALGVEIGYLRAMFEPAGTGFVLTLIGCTTLRYQPWDEAPIDDPAAIVARAPEISGLGGVDPVVVDCVGGRLELACAGLSIALENGAEVDEGGLRRAFDAYWDRWAAAGRGD